MNFLCFALRVENFKIIKYCMVCR